MNSHCFISFLCSWVVWIWIFLFFSCGWKVFFLLDLMHFPCYLHVCHYNPLSNICVSTMFFFFLPSTMGKSKFSVLSQLWIIFFSSDKYQEKSNFVYVFSFLHFLDEMHCVWIAWKSLPGDAEATEFIS
jgi:hypothetical protein